MMFIFIVYLNDIYLFELIYIGRLLLIFILYGDFIIIHLDTERSTHNYLNT